MNKTVKLVNEWASFEAKHPESDIEDFCRYYLISNRDKENDGKFLGGVVPPGANIILAKLIGRLSKLQMIYAQSALEGIGIKNFEEFNYLNAVYHLNEPKKTEVIYHNIGELSTGLSILGNLRDAEYLIEYDDKDDKRSKRVKLTTKGEETLKKCYERLKKASAIIFQEMAEDDISLCVQLLKNIEIKFSALWQQHKGKPFDEVYENMASEKNRTIL